jgi:superfamily II DNA helicase RecQ
VFKRETSKSLGFEFGTSVLRQLQASFDRRFIRTDLDYDLDEGPEDDIQQSAADLQAGHSGRVSRLTYGRTSNLLDAESMSRFRTASLQCHRFWEFESVPPKASFASASTSSSQQNQAPDSITGLVNNALTRLYRESEPRWSYPEQQLSVEAILSGESPLVCILPTGGGKSGLILLPAIIDSTKTSVVFTPYVALAQDLTQHCETLGIDCINWQPDTRLHRPTIVVVVIDTGLSDQFLTYIRDIDLDGQLARVYVDECQILVTERAF